MLKFQELLFFTRELVNFSDLDLAKIEPWPA